MVNLKRIYLLLHSLEFVVLMWIAITAAGAGPAWSMAALGYTQHMIADVIGNCRLYGFKPQAYFLIYRAMLGFDASRMVDKRERPAG